MAMTHIGPLTTTFTPPSDCYLLSIQVYPNTDDGEDVVQFAAYWPSGTRCFPSGYPTAIIDDSHYFSPGVCPDAWTSFVPSTTGTNVVTNCCPPGFTLSVDNGYTATKCWSEWGGTTGIATTAPTAIVFTGNYLTSHGSFVPVTTMTSFVLESLGLIEFDGFIVWNPILGATSSPQSPIPSAASSPQSSQTSAALESNNDTGLSSGAKIGIGVGIPLFVIIVAFITFFVIRRRKKSGPVARDNEAPQTNNNEKPELEDNTKSLPDWTNYDRKPELDTVTTQIEPPVELDQGFQMHTLLPELNGQRDLHSLPELETLVEASAPPPTPPVIRNLEIRDGKTTNNATASELETNPAAKVSPSRSHKPPTGNFPVIATGHPVENSSGPLPSLFELFPGMNHVPNEEEEEREEEEEDLSEEELQYREQRLKERRELLAEKERLTIEEDRLRRIRAKKGGDGGGGGKSS